MDSISKASLEDIPELEILVNSAYRGTTSRAGWTTEADYLDGIRVDKQGLEEMIKRKDACLLVLKKLNVILACVFLQKSENELYLGMLTVTPGLQARGYGKKLLSAAEDYAVSVNCNKIEITVISLRTELIAWYERHGFQLTGETKPFPDDPRFGIPKQPLEFAVMKKDLEHEKEVL